MPIRIACSCGKRLNAPDNLAGKTGKCPACGGRIAIPGPGPAAPAAKPRTPAPRPVSKRFYVGSFLGGMAGGLALVAAGVALSTAFEHAAPVLIAFVLALPAILWAGIVMFVLHYKMWSAIQAGPARTTPGAAVGLNFVPFFQFYWIFQSLWGWARDYNRFIAIRGIAAPRFPEAIPLTWSILAVSSVLYPLGVALIPAFIVLIAVHLARGCDAINALAAEPEKATAPLASLPTARPAVPTPRASGLALASLVAGVASPVTAGLSGLAAIGLGLVGLRRIRAAGGALEGRDPARVGIIVSCIYLALLAAMVGAAVHGGTRGPWDGSPTVVLTLARDGTLLQGGRPAGGFGAFPPFAVELRLEDTQATTGVPLQRALAWCALQGVESVRVAGVTIRLPVAFPIPNPAVPAPLPPPTFTMRLLGQADVGALGARLPSLHGRTLYLLIGPDTKAPFILALLRNLEAAEIRYVFLWTDEGPPGEWIAVSDGWPDLAPMSPERPSGRDPGGIPVGGAFR